MSTEVQNNLEEAEVKPLIQSNKELSRYIKELNEDVKLDMYNLREKALMSSSIWSKWLSYLYKEKENLTRIAETKSKVLKKKFSETKMKDSVMRLKAEEKIAESDETVQKLNKLQKITQDNIDYIERALTILSNFGFNIRNATEVVKLNMTH